MVNHGFETNAKTVNVENVGEQDFPVLKFSFRLFHDEI